MFLIPFNSTRTQNRPQEVATVSAEPAGSYSSRRNKQSARVNVFKPSTVHAQQVVATSEPYNANRRTFKPKIAPSPANADQDQQTTSLYKFKLNRTPGRWQYSKQCLNFLKHFLIIQNNRNDSKTPCHNKKAWRIDK